MRTIGLMLGAFLTLITTSWCAGRKDCCLGDLPPNADPALVSRRVSEQFLRTRPESYCPPGYRGNGYCNNGYGGGRHVQYSVVSIWVNALECARLRGDRDMEERLIRLYDDFLPGGEKNACCSRPYHVDDTIFGSIPYQIYLFNGDKRCLAEGNRYADTQWTPPCEGTLKERHAASPEMQQSYWDRGYTPQTRLWIDDMYMIIAIQSQAYRATGDRKYIERTAKEMCLYLDELQLKEGEAKGLFYHAPDVKYVWGRGDGWMAGGMTLVLKCLPEDSQYRPRIMAGYRMMMETLFKYQRADGKWSQLVDRPEDPRNWAESSCSAMFAYAFITGVKRGWLSSGKYGPAARKAWIALCDSLDEYANVPETCCGTGKRDDLQYYFDRTRVHGDPHGQAPMLWCAGALMEPCSGEDVVRTPAQSKLFVRHVDPSSGVVSYILRPGLLMFHQQSLYFTAKSMTDDGRFIVLDVAPDERAVKGVSTKTRVKALVDLLKDETQILDKTNGQIPWLDVERDQLWWLNADGVHRRDLLVDPQKDIIVCPCPPELTCPGRPASVRYGTHVTLSPDRKLMFIDGRAGDVEKEGVLNLETGKWEEWGRANFCCNHGQFNPVDPTMAMCAMEYCWKMTKGELTPGEVASVGMEAEPFMTKMARPHDDIYPRLWLFRKGEFWMVPSKIVRYATHECFAEDGKGFYWCAGGACYHDLATGRQWRINPCSAAHSSMSADNRYMVFDYQWGTWYRGCGWTVGFWNRETHRGVYIHSKTPKIASPDKQSRLHPDPHPQIVCNGRYALCTMNDDEGRMNLSVTPIDQLVALTSDPATAPTPRRFEVASWSPSLPQDAPFELEIDVKALRDRHLVAEPGCLARDDSYTPFALEVAGTDGKCSPVPFEAVQSPSYATRVVLRFNPPKDAKKLFYVADAPGRFEYYDSESCANLFARSLPHDLFPPKAAPTAKPGERTPTAVCAVPPEAAGRPVKFELSVRNLASQNWKGSVRLEMYDAHGRFVGDALGGRLGGKVITCLRRLDYTVACSLAKDAREVRLVIEGRNVDGGDARIQLQRLNLRVARVLPFNPPA